MTATVQQMDVLRDGTRVEVIAGDLLGEQGVVTDWTYRDLTYRHDESSARLYWVEIDGDPSWVPFLRDQLQAVDR